jgi:hypothetical protein
LGKAEAVHWLSARPRLAAVATDRWLDAQGGKRRGLRHPLYDLLQAGPEQPEIPAMFDALEAALSADVRGDIRSRARRLVSGSASDYWSAVAELYVAAALRACGLEVRLDSPDVVAVDRSDGSEVAIELTSVWRTEDANRLTEIIAGGWTGRYQPSIIVPDETAHFPTPVADRVLAAMLAADQRLQTSGGPRSDEEEIDISSIIAASKVRAFLAPRSPEYMATRSGPRSTIVDPWPDLEAKVQEKVRQLAGRPCALVAVDGTHMHVTAYHWAEMVKDNHVRPILDAPPNIGGVVLFWVDLRQHQPFRAAVVRNSNWPGPDPVALVRALDCLGASKRRVLLQPSAEELAEMMGLGDACRQGRDADVAQG